VLDDQPGILEGITHNKENLAEVSAELLKKEEEELSQVEIPKAKLKGVHVLSDSSLYRHVARGDDRFTQSAIRTAPKGASGTLSIQQHLSALETTIAELKKSNEELKTMNDQLRTTNERLITKI
jgi:hypothetical protein